MFLNLVRKFKLVILLKKIEWKFPNTWAEVLPRFYIELKKIIKFCGIVGNESDKKKKIGLN